MKMKGGESLMLPFPFQGQCWWGFMYQILTSSSTTIVSVSSVIVPICSQTPPTPSLQMFSNSWTTISQPPWQGITAGLALCLILGLLVAPNRKQKLFFTANSVNSLLATSRASGAITGTNMEGRNSSSAKTAPFTQALSKWHEQWPRGDKMATCTLPLFSFSLTLPHLHLRGGSALLGVGSFLDKGRLNSRNLLWNLRK